jgi:hypothetical protein
VRPILRSRLGARAPGLALLELTGRRSGRRYAVPVDYYEVDGHAAVLTASAWKANVRGGADVDVVHRGVREPMRAVLVEDPEEVAEVYLTLVARVGTRRARRVGVSLAGDRMPTRDELVEALGGRRVVVWLTPR